MQNVHTMISSSHVKVPIGPTESFDYTILATRLHCLGITATGYNPGQIREHGVQGPYITVASPTAQRAAAVDSRYAQILKEVAETTPSYRFPFLRVFQLNRQLKKHREYSLIRETNAQIKAERDSIEETLTAILAAFYEQNPRMNRLSLVKEHYEWSIEFQPLDPSLRGFGSAEKKQWLRDALIPFAELMTFLKTYEKTE